VILQPTPPTPPAFDPFIFGRLEEAVIGIVVTIALSIVAVKVLGPIARAWARRLEGKATPELRIEMDQVREQLAEVDELRARVLELEERVEFAERMLIQSGDPNLLPKREH
jgi:hypothetical protein